MAPKLSFLDHAVAVLRHIERSTWRRFIISFVVGLLVLAAMRVPLVDRSILGQLDREMMQMAFKMRADLISGDADPVFFIDVDDTTVAQNVATTANVWPSPPATTSRAVVADVLDYIRTAPQGQQPKVVIVDVDLATPTPGEEVAVARLRDVLAAWAQMKQAAPPLLLARESFPKSVLGGEGNQLVLPTTPYDDIVSDPDANIYWVQVKMLADQNGVVREFLPYECVEDAQGRPLYSAALLAFGFIEPPQVRDNAAVKHWISDGVAACGAVAPPMLHHGELINFHLSLQRGARDRVWPDLPDTWPGFRVCGPASDRTIVRQISARDVAAAGVDASHDLVCQRIVILGGTNSVASDFQQTPLDDMAGPMVLANAVRGLQLSRGGLQRVPLWLQLATLFIVSLGITGGFWITRRIRDYYLNLKGRHRGSPLIVKLSLLPVNPVVLNWIFAMAAHWTGVWLLLVSLDHGFWGYLSAPAFAAAATGAMQEFADDDEN